MKIYDSSTHRYIIFTYSFHLINQLQEVKYHRKPMQDVWKRVDFTSEGQLYVSYSRDDNVLPVYRGATWVAFGLMTTGLPGFSQMTEDLDYRMIVDVNW